MAYSRKCELEMLDVGTEMKFLGWWNRTEDPGEESCINSQLILTGKPALSRKERMTLSTVSAGISTGQERNLNPCFTTCLKSNLNHGVKKHEGHFGVDETVLKVDYHDSCVTLHLLRMFSCILRVQAKISFVFPKFRY